MTVFPMLPAIAMWTGGALPDGAAPWAGGWLIAAGAAVGVTAALAAALVQARRPVAGLAVLLVSAVLVPMEFLLRGSTFNLCFPLAAFICGCFALLLARRRGGLKLDRSRLVVAVLAFCASAVVSFLAGQYPWFPVDHAPMSAQLTGLGLFLLSAGLLLAVGHHVTTMRQLQRLTWLFVGTGAVAMASSIVSVFDISVGTVAISNASTIGSGFWTWLVAVSLGQALFNRALSRPARAALAVIAAAALGRGVLAAFSWASGWLPPLVAAGLLLTARFPRLTVTASLLAVTPALLYAGPTVQAWMTGESYSSTTRLAALRVMAQVIEYSPWVGFGPANYYYYTQLFPILGWWVPFNSHNNYIDLVGQVGVIGLLLFGWVVAEAWWLARGLRRRVPHGFERGYVMGVMAGLAGTLVSGLLADWIVPFTYNIGVRGFRSSLLFWFFLGGLLAMKRMHGAAASAAR